MMIGGDMNEAVSTVFTIPLKFRDKAAADGLAEAVAWADGYQAEIPNPDNPGEMIPNPQTKMEFAIQRVVSFLTAKKQAHDEWLASQAATPTPTDIGVVP